MSILTPKDIGALTREARHNAGLTQTELANKIGASRFWVAEFEQGKPRAELGLALKAMRELNLLLTITHSGVINDPAGSNSERSSIIYASKNQPVANLSAILERTATPGNWFDQTTSATSEESIKKRSPVTSKKTRNKPNVSKKKRA